MSAEVVSSSATMPAAPRASSAVATILAAGLIAGALDLGYIIVFYAVKGVPAARVVQGVAAGLIGRDAAFEGGLRSVALGLAIHFAIAVTVAAVFFLASRRLKVLINRPVISGVSYGLAVWLVMNVVVLPLSANPPRGFPPPLWLPVLIAHVFCVGLTIAFVVRLREKGRIRSAYATSLRERQPWR